MLVAGLICLWVAGCAQATDTSEGSGIAFTRVFKPNEAAFSNLMPRGWQQQGGIFRVNAAEAAVH